MVIWTNIKEPKFLVNIVIFIERILRAKNESIFHNENFLAKFCKATSGVLICTDVAARGLDMPNIGENIKHMTNYNLR